MTQPSRSYEDLGPGQQRYRVIEMCSNAETLYGKIQSGMYDWLGVQGDGKHVKYMLGRPPAGGSSGFAAAVGIHHAADGTVPGRRFVVQVFVPTPIPMPPSESWWVSEEEAREDFDRQRKVLLELPGSGLYRVALVVDGVVVDEDFVVRALPNRL